MALLLALSSFSTAQVVDFDVTGLEFCDEEGDLDNTFVDIDLIDLLNSSEPLTSVTVTDISWDLTITAGTNGVDSWLSEVSIGFDFDGDGVNDYALLSDNLSNTEASGTEVTTGTQALDPIRFVDGGIVTIELYDAFDDEADVCEAIVDMGTLSFTIQNVPEPTVPFACLLSFLPFLVRRQR